MQRSVRSLLCGVVFAGSWLTGQILAQAPDAGGRVPGEQWMQFADPREAGFDPVKLEAAREVWEKLPSSAFFVVADGAVVAAWGDTRRRFMCHSVRKSFLSALFGIYWDRGEIDLNKTLADLGIDDTPSPLLESERQARTLDLLKARSGVFHPAAYAGRTDSAPRGSKGGGRYFAYNNWDFNTLATILMEETGADVFDAFDEHFGGPLGMEDWRVSDGYYHYERDKSRYPAYPFRLSARDAARFGLLFTREGVWGDQRVLSKHWVRRSSALYSIDNEIRGYGFMWWIYREPRFERHGMYAALGVGNQMIAALPDSDLVIVNRANTYQGESTPDPALRDLIAQVLDARVGESVDAPNLRPLQTPPEPGVTSVALDRLMEYRGRFDYPAPPLGAPARTWVRISLGDGHLVAHSPVSGTFRLYLQDDGTFLEEDSGSRYLAVRDDASAFAGIADPGDIFAAALLARANGARDKSEGLLALVENETGASVDVARAIAVLLDGDAAQAERELNELVATVGRVPLGRAVNNFGGYLLGGGNPRAALQVHALQTRIFPRSVRAWNSFAGAQISVGDEEGALRSYEEVLEINPGNPVAAAAIARIRG